MYKEEFIKKYGEEAWEKRLERRRNWASINPEKVKPNRLEGSIAQRRKGGKFYDKHLLYKRTGFEGKRNTIRSRHGKSYYPYKSIIDPEGQTQIHHQWILGTAEYTGSALVEKDQHLHGIIDVIQILEGEITLFTEEAIRGGVR